MSDADVEADEVVLAVLALLGNANLVVAAFSACLFGQVVERGVEFLDGGHGLPVVAALADDVCHRATPSPVRWWVSQYRGGARGESTTYRARRLRSGMIASRT